MSRTRAPGVELLRAHPLTRKARGHTITLLTLALFLFSCTYIPSFKTRRPERVASERAAFDSFHGAPRTSGVTPIFDNAISWAARWEMLENARSRIDASTFILRNDVFGLAFLAHLYVRAEDGVAVRLLIDGRGSAGLTMPLLGRDLLQELASVGARDVEVRVFNPPLNKLMQSLVAAKLTGVAAGTHNKILVVDRQIALTGGRNIATMYFADFSEASSAVDDADVLIDGAAVRDIEAALDAEWAARDQSGVVEQDIVNVESQRALLLMMHAAMQAWLHGDLGPIEHRVHDELLLGLMGRATDAVDLLPPHSVREELRGYLDELVAYRSSYGLLPLSALTRHQTEVRVVSAVGAAQGHDAAANDAMLAAVAGARDEIVIQSPYLILSPELLQALVHAGQRGVRISVLTNSARSSDNVFAQALFIDTWAELEARIPTLRVFVGATPQMLHAKRATFDDDLTIIGTYNLDPFSAHINSEMLVAVWSPALTDETRSDMLRDSEGMLEYRIARDDNGRPRRHPEGHALAGQPVIAYGPAHHMTASEVEQLRTLKGALIATRGLWEFDVVVW